MKTFILRTPSGDSLLQSNDVEVLRFFLSDGADLLPLDGDRLEARAALEASYDHDDLVNILLGSK